MKVTEGFQLFRPLLAGATLRDRLLAALGALAGIGLTALLSGLFAADPSQLFWIVPPMGASAVLVFAVPASPMAQPWPVIGGNTISALIGIAVAHQLPPSALAAGIAVGGAIAAMSLLRCLHPPGGAAALVGLFAGASSSYLFAFLPVGLNAAVLVATGWAYHRLSRHSYPHVAPPPEAKTADRPWTFSKTDLDAVLEDIGEPYDISSEDLERLLRQIEQRALARSYQALACADIMTRQVTVIRDAAPPAEARALLLANDFRTLAVVDHHGVIVGAVGLRELADGSDVVRTLMLPPATVDPAEPAIGLLGRFAHERVHTVFVVDEMKRPVGVITEADWLNVLTRGLA